MLFFLGGAAPPPQQAIPGLAGGSNVSTLGPALKRPAFVTVCPSGGPECALLFSLTKVRCSL